MMPSLKEIFEDIGLEEDKFADLTKAYPDLSAAIENWKDGGVKPKYLPWLVQQIKKLRDQKRYAEALARIMPAIETINTFDKLVTANKMAKKDIGQYKDLEDLDAAIDIAYEKDEEKEIKKKGTKQVKKVFEDKSYLIVQPLSTEASQHYGKGTKWCISATKSENMFNNYTDMGIEFLFVIDKTNKQNNTAISFNAGELQHMYNAIDEAADTDEVSELFPEYILDELNKFFGKEHFIKWDYPLLKELIENVLDKMGKKKVSNSMRKNFIGGEVYTEFPSDRETEVVEKVSKNLHRIPYSHNPPTAPIGSEPNKRKSK